VESQHGKAVPIAEFGIGETPAVGEAKDA